MWLLIVVVVVLLLRAIATSKTAASVPMQNKTLCSSPTAGDSFTQGNTIAAGVPEPPQSPVRFLGPPIHCCHVSIGTIYSGLPIHVVYPVAPPPINITNPAQPVPAPISPKVPVRLPTPIPRPPMPIARPIYTVTPIRRPMALSCNCGPTFCGGGSRIDCGPEIAGGGSFTL